MGIADHYLNSATEKLYARISTVDPSTLTVRGVAKGAELPIMIQGSLPNVFVWPKEGETWSIYRENGNWTLGGKLPTVDDNVRIQDLAPGEGYISSASIIGGSYVNIQSFGALGKGADYTKSLVAAIDFLNSSGITSGGTLYIPKGEYAFSTTLDFTKTQNITLLGDGSNSARQATRLNWTGGVGSGPMITCPASDGLTLDGLKIVYTDPTYDGNLIACGSIDNIPATNLTIKNCWIGGGASRTAVSNIDLNGCVGAIIENNSIYNAVDLILGSISDFSNTINIRGNIFNFAANSSIRNPGEAWVIEGNSFEALANHTAGAISSTHNSSWPTRGLSVISNWFGDLSVNSGTWIDVMGNGLHFQGNNFDNRGMNAVTSIKLWEVFGATVASNEFREGGVGVDLAGADAQGITVTGNHFDNVPAPLTGTASIVGLNCLNNSGLAGFLELVDGGGDQPNAAAGVARLYLRHNGSGKRELCVRFQTGSGVVIATEP